jgi:hypothetical protein
LALKDVRLAPAEAENAAVPTNIFIQTVNELRVG